MKEIEQARCFFYALTQEEKEELYQVLAEEIFFLDETLQLRILELLGRVDLQLSMEVRKRNSFTTI